MSIIKLPDIVDLNKFSQIVITTPEPYGIGASIFINEFAKKIPSYNTEIASNLVGQSQGSSIEVNTLGRWLFGVPGTNPHVRIVSEGNKVSIYFPKEIHPIIDQFFWDLKVLIEHSN